MLGFKYSNVMIFFEKGGKIRCCGEVSTKVATDTETSQTHRVIESSDYDGYFGPIRCFLCVLQEKLILPNNGDFCENVSGGRCRSQPYGYAFASRP